jgi:3-oxoadipate enol-lactonase
MEAVVLLNGIMMTTASWVFQTRVLSPLYRLVLHDFRGQLQNLMPGPFTLQQHVEDLVELLDREGIERAHLIGTSYGGEVGMLFALEHPERIQSLAVIACASHVEPPLRASIEVWRDTARSAPETLYDVTAPYNFSPGILTETFMEAGRKRLRSHPPEFFTAFADLCDAFLTLDLTGRLPELTAPTLVIAAEQDRLKPLHYSETIASRIPNARLEVIPEAGHAVFLECATQVNELLLEWLAQQTSAR